MLSLQKAEEQARKDRDANLLFKYGQREYGRGEYAKAVEAFQSAVDLVTKGSLIGGEVSLLKIFHSFVCPLQGSLIRGCDLH
jgi:outer membrane protein assembly factor BamD (BamD/ComL family)